MQNHALTNKRFLSTTFPEIDENSRKCIDPGQMLNDTIIEFFMNYLIDKSKNLRREQVHLFSTFFYSKLKQINQTGLSTHSLDSIKRWDRKEKIFDKDYIVIPICESKHWFLVIICYAYNAPATVMSPSNEISNKRAAMITFDSLNYSYMYIYTKLIRKFLCMRWTYERPNDPLPKFIDKQVLLEVNAKVPRQRNLYDCGVHLLCYFENFVSDPIKTYRDVVEDEKDLRFEWSVDTERKRNFIRAVVTLAPMPKPETVELN